MMDEEITNKAVSILNKIQKKLDLDIKNSVSKVEKIKQLPSVKYLNQIQSNYTLDINQLKNICSSEKLLYLHHNYKNVSNQLKIPGISIIQSFYGNDISRILSTMRALQLTLQSNPIAEDFIFVEAQSNKNKAVFGWLKDYNVKYIFKKIDKDSEGLFLKTALWNIGVENTKAEKLCFIDSDVVFCNQNWLESVNFAFDNYDVLSLAGYCYYENSEKYNTISISIGHNVMTSNETIFDGHIGFNIGMTRKAYDKYGKFEAFNMHDDMWIWHRIFGSDLKPEIEGFTPYKLTEDMKFGLPFNVGSTEEIACHLNHENRVDKYRLYGLVSYLGTSYPFEDIEYNKDKIDVLPKWSTSKVGQCIRRAFKIIDKLSVIDKDFNQQAKNILLEARKTIYGEIDNNHPLIIMTGFVPSFKYKSIEDILEHKELLKKYCQQPFTYVCFTDEISIEEANEKGLDVIPFSSKRVRDNRGLWKNEMKRKNIKLPDNAVVEWVDLNKKIDKEIFFIRK